MFFGHTPEVPCKASTVIYPTRCILPHCDLPHYTMVLGFLLFALLAASHGAPVADTPYQVPGVSELHAVGSIIARELPNCVKHDRYRTTPQIIWTCLATIFACTWVVIHPNLPGPRDSGFHRLRRRITTMYITFIAPKLILYWAVKQWVAARKIKRTFNDKFNNGGEVSCADCPDFCSSIRYYFQSILSYQS
jgi:hypothetical protein